MLFIYTYYERDNPFGRKKKDTNVYKEGKGSRMSRCKCIWKSRGAKISRPSFNWKIKEACQINLQMK